MRSIRGTLVTETMVLALRHSVFKGQFVRSPQSFSSSRNVKIHHLQRENLPRDLIYSRLKFSRQASI